MTKIIDATDLILGRMLTTVAKEALNGTTIAIVNCEKIFVTGNRYDVISKYKHKRVMGSVFRGPYVPRRADMLVKRTLRGMLEYKKGRGLSAFKRVKCYIGVPIEFKGNKLETLKDAHISRIPNLKYTSMGEICKLIGAKQ